MNKLSFNLALNRILENVDKVTRTEKISVLEATGRVLVSDVIAPIDLPMLNRAAVDGYAVKYSDTAEASPDNPGRLKLVGKLTAGEVPEYRLKRGECLQVTTGSVMPEGSDAVVLVENTRLENNTVIVETPLKEGDYILHRGEDISAGEIVFGSGRLIRSQDIGAMAGLGIKEVEVLRKARVGIIITGNELLNPEDELNPAKTYDINSYALISEIKKIGAEPVWYGIVQDDYKTISSKLEEALDCDIVIATGGTGIGSLNLDINMQKEFAQDIFPFLIQKRGELLLYGVNSIPGKPLAFGKIDGKPVFALPGWPMSVMITFHFYVKPALQKITGSMMRNLKIKGVLADCIKSEIGITKFTLVKIISENGKSVIEPLPLPKPPSAARAFNAVIKADGVVTVPEDIENIEAGTEVDVKLF